MLKSLLADLKSGLTWLAEEMSRPVDPSVYREQAPRPGRSLSRRPAPSAPENDHDDDHHHHHHHAYDENAFSGASAEDGDGD